MTDMCQVFNLAIVDCWWWNPPTVMHLDVECVFISWGNVGSRTDFDEIDYDLVWNIGTVGNVSCIDIAYFIIAHNQLIYFVIMYQRSPEIARLRHGRSKEIARWSGPFWQSVGPIGDRSREGLCPAVGHCRLNLNRSHKKSRWILIK